MAQDLGGSTLAHAALSSPGSEVQRGRAPKVATHRGSLPASQVVEGETAVKQLGI